MPALGKQFITVVAVTRFQGSTTRGIAFKMFLKSSEKFLKFAEKFVISRVFMMKGPEIRFIISKVS